MEERCGMENEWNGGRKRDGDWDAEWECDREWEWTEVGESDGDWNMMEGGHGIDNGRVGA